MWPKSWKIAASTGPLLQPKSRMLHGRHMRDIVLVSYGSTKRPPKLMPKMPSRVTLNSPGL
jgi:hypothetical protein